MTNEMVTPLRVRSGYSLLRGTVGLESLLRLARTLGHTRLALTDVNNLYGATAFCKLASSLGVQPIVGAELREGGVSLAALVAGESGYENLCRLITRVHQRMEQSGAGNPSPPAKKSATLNPQSTILLADLVELSEGLEIVVADASPAETLLAGGLRRDQLWLGIDPATQSYPALRRLAKCAASLKLPLVATAPVLLAEAGDLELASLLAAIRLGTTFDAVAAELLPHPKAVLRDSKPLKAELAEVPEAAGNNRLPTTRCTAFKLLPRNPLFPAFHAPNGQAASAYLRRLCEQGMRRRYGTAAAEARRRLEKELSLIERMGFSEYFLVVWDIVQYAHRHNAPVAGRGSGASSLAAYVLGITNVCPLAYDIPFERFLNEQREDFPDLDIDFCWRIRDDVIDYAFRRWGVQHVAMVSTHNTFQPRSALRETAKAFGLSNEQISRLDEVDLQWNEKHAPRKALRGLGQDVSKRILKLSRRIIGLPHHLSVHPGGIVISPNPIDRIVPIQQSAKGVRITQYDKDGVEDIGLVKLDLLGNRNLSTIRAACQEIRKRRGRQIDIEALPPADPQTVELLQSARTVGCNQLESPAMRHLLRMMRPASTRDVMKILALIRPGAASLGMKEVFIRRHRGLEAVPSAPPAVEAVLRSTYGVMLYEDDVMLTAAAMLGCPPGQADHFRKAIQKCTTDRRRLELSREFLSRCVENGIEPDYAKSMWVQMAKYNAYSFCRAHAASYAALACAGAYLKAHWPLEFWTAALNNNQSMYHPRVYVEQAKRDGVRFLLPDVNRSAEEFSIDSGAVRVGLNSISTLGPAGAEKIMEARRRRPFDGLSDFLCRRRLSDEQARSLVLCGAFDSFGRSRPALMMELNLFCKHAKTAASRRGCCDQPTLLRTYPTIPAPPGDYGWFRKYSDERRILSISIRRHLMTLYRPLLNRSSPAAAIDSRQLEAAKGKCVRIAGVLEAQRTTRTERGEEMMFLTLDDEYGLFEVTLFPDVYRTMRGALRGYGPYIHTGKVQQQYGP